MAKIVFFGSSNFSASILQVLSEQHQVALVITQDDKPIGRSKKITETPVSALAAALGLKILKPVSLKDQQIYEQIKDINPDLFVVIAYGKIIPKNILEIPRSGPINIHASLLPKYRGASPIQTALLHGDKHTGITIMLMDELMDHGPILMQKPVIIEDNDSFVQLEAKLLNLAREMILEAVPLFINGDLPIQEQNHEQATFCKLITKQDGLINWHGRAADIFNQFRAYQTWPGIWTVYNGKVLKITECQLADSESEIAQPGLVRELNSKILVGCSEGELELLEVQLEGKRPVKIKSFLNGNPQFIGSTLGN